MVGDQFKVPQSCDMADVVVRCRGNGRRERVFIFFPVILKKKWWFSRAWIDLLSEFYHQHFSN